jgi:hypothetical protein
MPNLFANTSDKSLYKIPNREIGWKSLIWSVLRFLGINVIEYEEKLN